MKAYQIHQLGPIDEGSQPLRAVDLPTPEPGAGEVLVRVDVCGVCHTELDEIEGRTAPARLPVTPGHQVVGRVVRCGTGCSPELEGQRVGIAWIHSACGRCEWCRRGAENLCPDFCATGRDADGGYAEFMVAPEQFVHSLPDAIDDRHAAPLLCAGAVGWRALKLCELSDGDALGFTGFGASAHLVLQMAHYLYPTSALLVWARDPAQRDFALQAGANWAGDTEESAPVAPQAIIDTTPAWKPVLCALEQLAPGGRLVINAIRKESADHDWLTRLDYDRHLWREKSLRTVANVGRSDVRECLELAERAGIRPQVEQIPLEQANRALSELKSGGVRGAKVLKIREND